MKLSRNSLLNLAGALLPLVLTFVTLPFYLRLIGDIRFGVLAIVWLLLSYFGMFDMGLGRATSKYIAELHDASDSERESLFWTSFLLNAGMGTIGAIVLWTAGHFLLANLLNVPAEFRPELLSAMPWLAAAVPVATVVSVLIGSLEGRERFLCSNATQVFGAAVFQTVPLAVAYWHGPHLKWLIGSAVLARASASIPMFLACRKYVPLVGLPKLAWSRVRSVLGFGGWVTVSGLLTPLLNGLDRFIIGLGSGPQAIAYYSVAYNFSTKYSLIPGSVSRALFPSFSKQTEREASTLARDAVLGVAVILTPVVLVSIVLVHPFFTFWLGPYMAERCFRPAEILLLGVWVNGLAFVPYALLQGQNRPEVVAKFHAIEVLPFLVILWIGIKVAGVEGAAVAWTVRVTVDAALLFWASRSGTRLATPLLPAFGLICATLLGIRFYDQGVLWRLGLAFSVGCIGLLWAWILAPEPSKAIFARSIATLGRYRGLSRAAA